MSARGMEREDNGEDSRGKRVLRTATEEKERQEAKMR